MLKLIQLELKRNNIKTYIVASGITCIVMIGFIYLFAYAPHIDPDPDLQIFASYHNIVSLFSVLTMVVFATISATMYTRFIIEEYKDKRVILLFSYPVKRYKIVLAKLLVVFLFTVMAMILCNVAAFGIFSISEFFYPLVSGTLSLQIMVRALKMTIIMAVTAAAVGIIGAGIGFIKKSVPATILSAVLLASLYSNIVFKFLGNASKHDAASIVFMCVALLTAIGTSLLLMKKITDMEVE